MALTSQSLGINELKTIIDQSQILIWRSNTEALCDYFNVSWLNFTGRSIEQELGNGWTEGVHPDDFDRCLKIYLDHFHSQLPFEMEYRLRRYDGEYRWLFDKGVPYFNSNGKFNGYIGSCFDISDRRVKQEHLQALSIVASETENSVVIADKDGKIEWVNDSFTRITEYSLEEIVGKKPGEFLQGKKTNPEDIAAIREKLKTLQPFVHEIFNYSKSGRGYWLHLSITPIFNKDGELYKFVAIQSDVTERKKRELELIKAKEEALRSELKLKQTQSLAKVGGWEFDLSTGLFLFNDNFYEIFRSSVDKVGGYQISAEAYASRFIYPEDRSVVEIATNKAIQATDPDFSSQMEHRIIYEDGEVGYVFVNYYIIKNEQGKTVKLYGFSQDITKGKQIERELIQSKYFAEKNEERYRALLTNVEIGIVVHAKDTSIITCNNRSEVLLGLSDDQMKGKVAIDPYWSFVTEDGKSIPLEDYPVMRVLKTKSIQRNQILGVLRPNQETIWLLVNGFPEIDNNGEINTITISFIDITKLQKTVEEKDRLFKELHHRIKNNLQMVSGLMYTKSIASNDERLNDFIKETINRVNSIAKIHDRLLQLEEFDKLYTKYYLEDLINGVINSLAYDASNYLLELNIEDHKLRADDILALGLITNESISNIIKHAYDVKSGGKISVSFKSNGNEYILIIKDYGKGFTLTSDRPNSLGLIMIEQLSKQLRGSITRGNENGSSFELKFPAKA